MDITSWTIDDVCEHFIRLGAEGEDVVGLRKGKVDGEALSEFTEGDLKDMGIPIGIVKKHQKWMNGTLSTNSVARMGGKINANSASGLLEVSVPPKAPGSPGRANNNVAIINANSASGLLEASVAPKSPAVKAKGVPPPKAIGSPGVAKKKAPPIKTNSASCLLEASVPPNKQLPVAQFPPPKVLPSAVAASQQQCPQYPGVVVKEFVV